MTGPTVAAGSPARDLAALAASLALCFGVAGLAVLD